MRRGLLLMNYLAVVGFLFAWLWIEMPVDARTNMKATELDRANVINRDNLQKSFPYLADNPRYKLGRWVAQDEHTAARTVTLAGLGLALMNILMLHCIRAGNRPAATST